MIESIAQSNTLTFTWASVSTASLVEIKTRPTLHCPWVDNFAMLSHTFLVRWVELRYFPGRVAGWVAGFIETKTKPSPSWSWRWIWCWLVNHVNQVQRLSANWFIWYSADTCKPCQQKHNGFSQKTCLLFPNLSPPASSIRSLGTHHTTSQVGLGLSELSVNNMCDNQQGCWSATVCVWQSTVNNVLIVLLWTLRQQCVWRSTIAVVYKPRIDNNRWKLWQSIGRTSDIHKQMTHSVKHGSLLSCVIDQPT